MSSAERGSVTWSVTRSRFLAHWGFGSVELLPPGHRGPDLPNVQDKPLQYGFTGQVLWIVQHLRARARSVKMHLLASGVEEPTQARPVSYVFLHLLLNDSQRVGRRPKF